MEVQEKKGNAPGSLVNGSGLVPVLQNSRSEVTHFSHSLLLPALERHKAARSSAGRLTVKGGEHGARAISPSAGAAVTGETAAAGGPVLEIAIPLNAGVKGFGKYLHFCKKTF